MARSARREKGARKLAGMRPMLLAAGIGLFWFAQFQDGASDADAPAWGWLVMDGVRLFADFVGAWLAISAVRLVLALMRHGLVQLRALWLQGAR